MLGFAHWLVNHYPIRDHRGDVLGVGSVVLEITEVKRAEQALRDSEARKSAMLSSAFDGIVAIDESGRVIEFNPAAERMFGHTREDVLGKPMSEYLMPERFRMEHKRGLQRFLVTGSGPILGKSVEVDALRANGSEFPVELAITVAEGREPRVFIGYIRDISDRKRAETERERLLADLRQAVQVRDEFLSIASHELKTPITSLDLQVASALQMLRQAAADVLPLDKLESKMQGASRQITRLTILINNLLDVTRITAGNYAFKRAEVDLKRAAQSVLGQLETSIRRSGSEVTLKAPEGIVGYWDPIAIETILGNLLSNAVKFGQGKPIEVEIERREAYARRSRVRHRRRRPGAPVPTLRARRPVPALRGFRPRALDSAQPRRGPWRSHSRYEREGGRVAVFGRARALGQERAAGSVRMKLVSGQMSARLATVSRARCSASAGSKRPRVP